MALPSTIRSSTIRSSTIRSSTIRSIVLIGFMGAGKSTTGALLAEHLGWEFVDCDLAIEARTGRRVAEIFSESGEAAFRAMEAELIHEQVNQEQVVLALGGGAVENNFTRAALNAMSASRTVFLDAPLEVLVARCLSEPNAAERPVLADRDRLLERLEQRLPHYRAAHLTVNTASLTPAAVAERILFGLFQSPAGDPWKIDCDEEKGLPTR